MDMLVVLSRLPTPGKTKTRLAQEIGVEAAARIHLGMLIDTVKNNHSLNITILYPKYEPPNADKQFLDLFHRHNICCQKIAMLRGIGNNSDEDKLYGHQQAQQHGFRPALIGSDTPQITAQHINKLFSTLDNYDVVFYPHTNGNMNPHATTSNVDLWTNLNSDMVINDRRIVQRCEHLITNCRRYNLSFKALEMIYEVDWLSDLEMLKEDFANQCPFTMQYAQA